MIEYNKNKIRCNCNNCSCGLCRTEIRNLSVKKGEEEILKNINIHVHCGELMAVIGANGAGKSTLLKAIIGEDSYSGSLRFTDGNNRLSRKPIIGYVPQKLDFDYSSPISVLDFFRAINCIKPVYLQSSKEDEEKCIRVLDKVNAKELMYKKIGILSGGELQRVLLAFALEPIPDILLLDEPVSGIDQNGLKIFYNVVSEIRKKYGLSIVLVSHDFNLVAKYADSVVFLNNKTVECIGTPKEVFQDSKVIEVFGLDWNIFIDKIRNGVDENVSLV